MEQMFQHTAHLWKQSFENVAQVTENGLIVIWLEGAWL